MTFKLSENSKKHRAGIDPRLIAIDDLAITLTPIDYGHGPYSGLRTDEEQAQLFAEGKSQKDGIIHRSDHQDGKALDFYAVVDGRASWAPEHLAIVAAAYYQAAMILGHRIRWGGLFKPFKQTGNITHGWDMPHIELLDD